MFLTFGKGFDYAQPDINYNCFDYAQPDIKSDLNYLLKIVSNYGIWLRLRSTWHKVTNLIVMLFKWVSCLQFSDHELLKVEYVYALPIF